MQMSAFFFTYLRRELSRRVRQAVFVALGLALGVGLVVTVNAASAGVKKAETGVLSGMYGVATAMTVSGPPPPTGQALPQAAAKCRRSTARVCSIAPGVQCRGQGPDMWCGGGAPAGSAKESAGGGDILFPPLNGTVSASTVAAVARLHGVAAATGVLTLVYQWPGGTDSVDGVATGHTSVGPLSAARVVSGHYFTAPDSDADVALVDSGYAAINNLKVGSAITIRQIRFTVIGVVLQPQGTSPPDVYIPLARAQALGSPDKHDLGNLANQVNLIYVAAASAADIPAVQSEISRLLPGDTVTAASSLASEVTGSLSTFNKLANDLGKWVSVLALIAAFAIACLLMMGAVAHRSEEFGTLKSLGWRTRQVVGQVLGESLVIGVVGAAVGVGLGFAGAAIITAVAPNVSGTLVNGLGQASAIGSMHQAIQNGSTAPVTWGAVTVPLSLPVSGGVIVLAVVLAMAGGLLAGLFGSWRAARLRPADALRRVE
jgi:putative ABC transport system permease protein